MNAPIPYTENIFTKCRNDSFHPRLRSGSESTRRVPSPSNVVILPLNFSGGTIFEKYANVKANWLSQGMDDKVAALYVRAYSAKTLQQWNDEILGGEMNKLTMRLSDIASEVA